MKHLPQFPSILAICCFCILQIPSSGFSRPLPDPPGDLDIVQLERLAYWAMLSRQPKDNQDIYKRFLFHYSRTQEPTYAIKTGFPPVHPLMRLAAKLANRRVKRLLHHDSGTAPVDFSKKSRNRGTTEENNQSEHQGQPHCCSPSPSKYFNGTGKLDQMRQSSNYFKQMLNFFL